jgi:hypothetical protein
MEAISFIEAQFPVSKVSKESYKEPLLSNIVDSCSRLVDAVVG